MTPTPLLADAALAVSLAAHVELLARLRRVDPAQPPWWYGYARDGANLAAALMLWGSYLLVGYPPPVALCAAMLTTLGVYLGDWMIARWLRLPHARLWAAAPLALWVAWIAAQPSLLGHTLERMIVAAQPR